MKARSNAPFDLQFDEEIMGRQDALAQLLKKEEKINELEAEVQAFRTQVLPFSFFFFQSWVFPLLSPVNISVII